MASAGRIRPVALVETPSTPERIEPIAGVPLIFELSSEGRRGTDLSPRATGDRRGAELLGAELCREDLPGFPELSEPQVLRHFLRLSQLNFAQALQFYPLGSCTMKYNPVVNDELAALPGMAGLHPATPSHLAQGALELIARMEAALAEITGMDAVSLHPAAGAQGELTGLLMVRAYHRKRGEARHKVIIPDTAHGTNPASCTLAGFEVIVAKSNQRGFLEAAEVRRLVSDDVAAMMVTNPNTLGIFEPEIQQIAAALHERGAMLYLDGANMNALLGVAKPGHMGADIVQLNLHKSFSTPHGGGGPGAGPVAVKKHLEPFLPMPRLKHSSAGYEFDAERPDSIGRMRSFHNNFGMIEIAKRLLDFGIHPPTIYFPLVVPGALMIEPTETESKEILDSFIEAMEKIYDEALNDPDRVKNAPQTLPVSRVDEAQAARRPILRWERKA